MKALSAAIRKLETRMEGSGSLLCVGLDPEPEKIPLEKFSVGGRNPIVGFCLHAAALTAEYACAFKLNTAFFEARGSEGWRELESIMTWLLAEHPDHFIIIDAKRADIGNTNRGYARSVFDRLGADAITLHPYLGREANEPFLSRGDKASAVLCRTSNAGAGEFQDLEAEGRPLWQHVAERVSSEWNAQGNCMLVVGATWPEEMRRIRAVAPEMTFLVPGIGAQGGDIEATVCAGLRADGKGLLLSSSRAILYSEDPARAARETRDAIQHAREVALANR